MGKLKQKEMQIFNKDTMKEEFSLVFAGHHVEPQKRVSNVEELIANAGDEWLHKTSVKKVPRLILLFREQLA